jgi:cell wall-associated NlpC family hydrolase
MPPPGRPSWALAACIAGLTAAAPAAAHPVSSHLNSGEVLAQARAGGSAAAILGQSFPGASLAAAPNPRVRVLIADLAPQIILAARVRPALLTRGRRIDLAPDHRYRFTRARQGWRMRDLDGSPRARRLAAGPVRFVSGAARPEVLMADPLNRRFRGALELRPSDGRSIYVVNRVPTEQWIRGAVAGDVPTTWLSTAPAALEVATILARSRALAATAHAHGTWDLSGDDPLYLGLDGEEGAAVAAVVRTRGQMLVSGGAPVEGLIPTFGAPGAAFAPTPGRPRQVATAPAHPIPGAPVGLGPRVVALAQGQLGTPYRWGGSAPGAFDCSGLVYWAFKTLGVTLPRVAEDQALVGYPVPQPDLQPGDVVFFADNSGYVHHEGVYIGAGQMIHAPQTGDVVRVERIDSGYYARQYAGARRFSPSS